MPRRLPFALLRAVLDVFPVFGPFLAPLERQTAALTDLGFEPVLDLGYRWHAPTLIQRDLVRICFVGVTPYTLNIRTSVRTLNLCKTSKTTL